MNRNLLQAAFLALIVGTASASNASVSETFAGCDGLKKPKKSDDGIRGVAVINFGFGAQIRTSAKSRILYCNDAISHKDLLPSQNLRRAHLLRARATAYLQMNDSANALADLNAAELEIAGRSGDIFLQRSLGASLKMLRAMAHSSAGNHADAVNLASEATKLRPYSVQMQMASAIVQISAANESGNDTASIKGAASPAWSNIIKLSPNSVGTIVSLSANSGNFVAVASLADQVRIEWPEKKIAPHALLARYGPGAELGEALTMSRNIAYAKAVVGDVNAAKKQMVITREKLASLITSESNETLDANTFPEGLFDAFLNVVDARIAVSEGRIEDARSLMTNLATQERAKFTELNRAFDLAAAKIKSVDPTAKTENPIDNDQIETENPFSSISDVAELMLIAPEAERSVINYQKSRPDILGALVGGALTFGISLLGGMERTAGFESQEEEGGITKVAFIGNTTSGPMVQEMTLLRAAELAQQAKKPYFSIVDRKDYQRWSVVSRSGFEVRRDPVGYKTELKVRFLDAESPEHLALQAIQVIDDLGPYYYGD